LKTVVADALGAGVAKRDNLFGSGTLEKRTGMSLEDTLVGAGLTLLGFAISFLVEERRSKREVRLGSLGDRQAALNDVFVALTDCFFDLRAAIHRMPKTSTEYNQLVVAPISKCERTIHYKALWLSTTWREVTNALQAFGRVGLAIQVRLPDIPRQSLPPPDSIPLDVNAFEKAYFSAGNAIGRSLGIPILENTLQCIMGTPDIDASQSAPSQ
jgi:hypothetical protein